jgi:hypothetical protein
MGSGTQEEVESCCVRLAVDTKPTAFWFPAKRYGWGWGLPVRWQGWVVFGTYLTLICAGKLLFRLKDGNLVVYLVVLTALLIVVVAVKGEKPLAWRWGRK